MTYALCAIVRCIALLPVALVQDVRFNLTKQYVGNPDWVAKQEM